MFVKEVLQQKTIGCVLVGGSIVFCCSGILMLPLGFGSAMQGSTFLPALLIGLMALSVLVVAGGVFYGIWISKSENRGPRKVVSQFRVIARYAYDRQGYHLVDDDQIEFADRPRFYIRGQTPDRINLEYEATEYVWRQAGEGMTGEVELEGKWIGRFTPYIGTTNSSPYNS